MRLVFSTQARADLAQIGDYIAQDNPARALTFVDELEARSHLLTQNPLLYPVLPRYQSSGIRRLVHGNYLMLYRVEANSVIILHVVHGAMDYEARLFPKK